MYRGIILAVKSCNDEEQKTNANEEATATVIS